MSTTQPLLVTTDEGLAEEVFRLAAVAGCDLRRLTDPAAAGAEWRSASLLLLDGPAATAVAGGGFRAVPGS